MYDLVIIGVVSSITGRQIYRVSYSTKYYYFFACKRQTRLADDVLFSYTEYEIAQLVRTLWDK